MNWISTRRASRVRITVKVKEMPVSLLNAFIHRVSIIVTEALYEEHNADKAPDEKSENAK